MVAFLFNRALRNWQVLLIVLFGVLVSTTILASGPLIVNTVIDFALRHNLESSREENGTIVISLFDQLNSKSFEQVNNSVKDTLISNIEGLSNIFHSIESPWAYPWQEDLLIEDERVNFETFHLLEDHINLISGEWPSESALNLDVIPVLVFEPMAQAYKFSVGDRLPLSLNRTDKEPTFWIEIAGIVEPIDARSPFWYLKNHNSQANTDFRFVSQFSAVISEVSFFELVRKFFPDTNLQCNWLATLDIESVTADQIDNFVAEINHTIVGFADMEKRYLVSTNIDHFLEQFDLQASSVKPPLYLLVGEILFLGLYYVTMVAALFARQAESEYATISSRGASLNQLLQMQTFDAILICTIALVFGPLLAYGLVWGLSVVGPIADVSPSAWITNLPEASWIAAGVSVLACFTGLLIPVIPYLRSSIVEQKLKTARRTEVPWWQKFYIDIFILVFALIALWRLSLYGSISSSSGGTIDWILLFAPLALLIGSATILLRLFPAIFSILAKFSARSRGLIAPLALWQSSRDPAHVTRLVLLFTLAMALGILSTGLNITLDQSEQERARYSAGGEIRLASESSIPLSRFDSMSSVTGASAVWRSTGKANSGSYRSMEEFDLLAVEPFSFATVSQYRTDFTDEYIGFVLGRLIVEPEQLPVATIRLPDRPKRFGLWIADPSSGRTAEDLLDRVIVRAKFQTSEGKIFIQNLVLTPVSDNYKFEAKLKANNDDSISGRRSTWRFFEADLPILSSEEYPVSLHSLWMRIQPVNINATTNLVSQGVLVIDNLSITNMQGEYKIVEGFEQLSTIWQTGNFETIASYTKHEITHTGDASMRLFFGAPGYSNWLILSPATAVRKESIPALASPVFLQKTDLTEGDKFTVSTNGLSLLFEITETVNYFPTLYESTDRGFLVVARDPLLAELNKASRKAVNANEIWLNVENTHDIPSLLDQFNQASHFWDVESERIKFKSDPLTLGLRTVIFLGFSMTLLLSLVGFTTYFYMNARHRSSIYGILRSLGITTLQLYASLVIEQLILILSGLAIGIFLGLLLNDIILPGLPISFGGLPAIPPFIPYEDWDAIISMTFLLIIFFLITLAIGTFLLWRMKLHRILRIGEE